MSRRRRNCRCRTSMKPSSLPGPAGHSRFLPQVGREVSCRTGGNHRGTPKSDNFGYYYRCISVSGRIDRAANTRRTANIAPSRRIPVFARRSADTRTRHKISCRFGRCISRMHRTCRVAGECFGYRYIPRGWRQSRERYTLRFSPAGGLRSRATCCFASSFMKISIEHIFPACKNRAGGGLTGNRHTVY